VPKLQMQIIKEFGLGFKRLALNTKY